MKSRFRSEDGVNVKMMSLGYRGSVRILGYVLTAAVLHVVVFALSAGNNHQDVDDFLVGVTLVQRQMDPLAVADAPSAGQEHLLAEPSDHSLTDQPAKVDVAEGQDAIDEPNVQGLPIAANHRAPDPDKKLANVVEEPPLQPVQRPRQPQPQPEAVAASPSEEMSAPPTEPATQPAADHSLVAKTMAQFQPLQGDQGASKPGYSQGVEVVRLDRQPSGGQMAAQPRYGYHPPPAYPAIARRRGWEGTVELNVRVLANGTVGEVTLKISSGYKSLDDAARRAITRWRFTPAHRAGSMVESWVVVPVHFVLDAQTRSR